jgi:hypothetical protein
VHPSKKLNEKRTRKTMSISGVKRAKGLDSTQGFLGTPNFFLCSLISTLIFVIFSLRPTLFELSSKPLG